MPQVSLTTEANVLSTVRKYLDDFFTDLQEEYRQEYKSLYRFWCSAILTPRALPTVTIGFFVFSFTIKAAIYTKKNQFRMAMPVQDISIQLVSPSS